MGQALLSEAERREAVELAHIRLGTGCTVRREDIRIESAEDCRLGKLVSFSVPEGEYGVDEADREGFSLVLLREGVAA